MTDFEADDFLREVPEPALQLARNIIRLNLAEASGLSAVMIYSEWRDSIKGEIETVHPDGVEDAASRMLDLYGYRRCWTGFNLETKMPEELGQLCLGQGLKLDEILRHVNVDAAGTDG